MFFVVQSWVTEQWSRQVPSDFARAVFARLPMWQCPLQLTSCLPTQAMCLDHCLCPKPVPRWFIEHFLYSILLFSKDPTVPVPVWVPSAFYLHAYSIVPSSGSLQRGWASFSWYISNLCLVLLESGPSKTCSVLREDREVLQFLFTNHCRRWALYRHPALGLRPFQGLIKYWVLKKYIYYWHQRTKTAKLKLLNIYLNVYKT